MFSIQGSLDGDSTLEIHAMLHGESQMNHVNSGYLLDIRDIMGHVCVYFFLYTEILPCFRLAVVYIYIYICCCRYIYIYTYIYNTHIIQFSYTYMGSIVVTPSTKQWLWHGFFMVQNPRMSFVAVTTGLLPKNLKGKTR